MRLWAAAHAIDDMYQGLVPASVPYFVLDRHYSYVAASGLALAATLGSSLPQPVIGLLVDKWRLGWMAAAGVSLAGAGAGLSGLAPAYPMVWLLLLASGLGVAMFHPAAGKSARADAGESASAMSIFAAGGSAGFFLAPVLATPALVSLGLGATALFIPPAMLIGLFLLRHHQRALASAASRSSRHRAGPLGAVPGDDRGGDRQVRGVLRGEHVHRAVLDPPPGRQPRPGRRGAGLLPRGRGGRDAARRADGRPDRAGPCPATRDRHHGARAGRAEALPERGHRAGGRRGGRAWRPTSRSRS